MHPAAPAFGPWDATLCPAQPTSLGSGATHDSSPRQSRLCSQCHRRNTSARRCSFRHCSGIPCQSTCACLGDARGQRSCRSPIGRPPLIVPNAHPIAPADLTQSLPDITDLVQTVVGEAVALARLGHELLCRGSQGVPTALSLAWRHWALGSSPVVPGVCMVLPLSLPPGAPDTPGSSPCSRARAAAACSPPGQTTAAILLTPTPRAPLTTLFITVVTTVIVPVAVPQAPDAIAVLAGELIFLTLPGGCGHRAVRLLQAQQEAPRTGPAGYSNTAIRDLKQGALSWAHLTKRESERRDKELKTLEQMWTWGIIFRLRIPSQQSLMEPAWRHRHSRQSCSSESSSQSLSPSHTQERRMHLPLSQ